MLGKERRSQWGLCTPSRADTCQWTKLDKTLCSGNISVLRCGGTGLRRKAAWDARPQAELGPQSHSGPVRQKMSRYDSTAT